MTNVRQSCLAFPVRGGARQGAGRKRRGARANVAHRARERQVGRHPVHVTVRMERGLESLRSRRAFRVVRGALFEGCNRFGMRLVHFAVLANHVHLICEADDERALSRGMKGLGVRLARSLNRLWARSGRVVADRFHSRALRTPREVRNALGYLLNNARRHGDVLSGVDPCSSGTWFDGWKSICTSGARGPLPEARTWLLRIGWRRHGPIELDPLASG